MANGRDRWSFGDCELDLAARELRVHGEAHPVEPKAFDLLAYLLNHRERVISHDELMAALPASAGEPEPAAGGEAPQLLMYTSGTTGTPKGALLPHRKAVCNTLNAERYFGLSRDDVVVVPQEGFLFAGTITENVRLARPSASDAEVREALERIGVLEVFERLPDGLDTEVQERGSRLSAGEKQLVSLARAALADPQVLILDEATSSVDPGTEAVVEVAMEALMEGRTVIAIAHRLSTSERCDRVALFADGRLAELGSHRDLVASGGRYAELFDAWTAGLAR